MGRLIGILLVIWLIIGAFAAFQRGYFDDTKTNCSEASDIALNIVAGPLNYTGLNPKVKCADIDVARSRPSRQSAVRRRRTRAPDLRQPDAVLLPRRSPPLSTLDKSACVPEGGRMRRLGVTLIPALALALALPAATSTYEPPAPVSTKAAPP